ncbi:hypothetical protein ACQKCU_01145 [Heyndrickxia sporothermodurans]
MKWGTFFATTLIIIVIIFFQWPKLKQASKKDKGVFFSLLFIGWMLSMFDLPRISGPTSWISAIFEPFGQMLEK